MSKNYLQWSLRKRVLVPTVAGLCIAFAGLIFTVVKVQTLLIGGTLLAVNEALESTEKEVQGEFRNMSAGIDQQLKTMAKDAGESLTGATAAALEKEKDVAIQETQAVLRQTAESLATLLARVAPAPILSKNFLDLLNYSRSTTQNANVVYALFLDAEGKPLTRYLKKDDPIIERLLNEGKGDGRLDRVMEGSKRDPALLVTEKDIEVEGQKLGKVLLCLDLSSAEEKAKLMSERFASLIEGNRQMVHSVLEKEGAKVTGKMDVMMKTLGDKSSASTNAMEALITSSFGELSDRTWKLITELGIASLLLVVLILLLVVSKMTKRMLTLLARLGQGSTQVAEGSRQVTHSSQTLADGASAQAASIEETSSSLEEMSSMTKQNAENASHADGLMKNADQVVTKANGSMEQLTQAMAEITKASEETSKIIKTIDEIAFQTNLLALNAAVEAARAGEAGSGFAVVADEVRNLAMRAADAAKTTATLIEGTVKRVNEGSGLVVRTNKAFSKVAGSAAKVGGLVAEIAAASSEQARGIEQVNRAVAEMDKVVQQNASGAEESAAAAEKMSGQAAQMKGIAAELVLLVSGKGGMAAKLDE